ncbi:unnamed protein product [Clonostachys chloroleuca]|uniref:Uncharacterized protein n=1 Tax=Clonostachys chloroleuca TaxID=1926264 RepID=A0AA35M199_9HYPO|nr:unnamed protein product [Clonostachys chloroleuca]
MPSLKQIFVLAAPFMGLIQQVAANPDIDESSDLIARDDFDSDIYVRGAGNGLLPLLSDDHDRWTPVALVTVLSGVLVLDLDPQLSSSLLPSDDPGTDEVFESAAPGYF